MTDFEPKNEREKAKFILAKQGQVELGTSFKKEKVHGIQIFLRQERKGLDKKGLRSELDMSNLATKIDKHFSKLDKEVQLFEQDFDAKTSTVSLNKKIGEVKVVSYKDAAFPIARNRKGNFIRIIKISLYDRDALFFRPKSYFFPVPS